MFISPHLDDAALSCGGLISDLSKKFKVEVWTIFCAAPVWGPYSSVAKWFHSISGGKTGSRLMSARRLEDQRALRILGVHNFRHFRWYDAVYRKRFWSQFLYNDCRQTHWHPADDRIVDKLRLQLHTLLNPDDVLVCPAGIGKHVDHLITAAACNHLQHFNTIWYAEVPYLQRFPLEHLAFSADKQKLDVKVSKESLGLWTSSVLAYGTQLKMLNEACGDVLHTIRTYANESGVQLYRCL